MKSIFYISLFLLCLNPANSQSEIEMIATNVLSNGITTGVSSLINKPKHKKLLPYMLRSFGYGCLGGGIIYGAKKTGELIVSEENLAYGQLSKLVFCIGSSINYNVARNMKPFEEFTYFFGFSEFSYNFREHRFRVFLNPYSLIRFLILVSRPEITFSIAKTFEIGDFYFEEQFNLLNPPDYKGYYNADYIVVNDLVKIYRQLGYSNDFVSTPTHERVHLFQDRELLVFNKAVSHRLGIDKFFIQNDARIFDLTYSVNSEYYESEAYFFSRIR
jgi:hypothetical protein